MLSGSWGMFLAYHFPDWGLPFSKFAFPYWEKEGREFRQPPLPPKPWCLIGSWSCYRLKSVQMWNKFCGTRAWLPYRAEEEM